MKTIGWAALATAAGAVLGGCASLAGDETVASTPSPECKAVAVYSTREEMRNQNRPGVEGDALARAQGAAGIHRLKVPPTPPALRSRAGTGLLDDALRDC